jgi:molecular chaperone GrpE (heat shock protein)
MALQFGEISPLDHKILSGGGSTTATERLPSQLQQAKAARQQNLMKQNWENGRLRREIALYEDRQRALACLYHQCLGIQESFSQAMNSASKEIDESENKLLRSFGLADMIPDLQIKASNNKI